MNLLFLNLSAFVIFVAMFLLINIVKSRFTEGKVKQSIDYYALAIFSIILFFLNRILSTILGFFDISNLFVLIAFFSIIFSLEKFKSA